MKSLRDTGDLAGIRHTPVLLLNCAKSVLWPRANGAFRFYPFSISHLVTGKKPKSIRKTH
jgi:hypothetical protein